MTDNVPDEEEPLAPAKRKHVQPSSTAGATKRRSATATAVAAAAAAATAAVPKRKLPSSVAGAQSGGGKRTNRSHYAKRTFQ